MRRKVLSVPEISAGKPTSFDDFRERILAAPWYRVARIVIVALSCVVCMRSTYIAEFVGVKFVALDVLVAFAVYVLERGFRLPSRQFVALMLYFVLGVVSTAVHARALSVALATVLHGMVMLTLFESFKGSAFWDAARTVVAVVFALSVLDVISMFVAPHGLYYNETSRYVDHYLLGYKTVRVWLQVPALALAMAESVHRTGRIRPYVIAFFALCLYSVARTQTSMGGFGLCLMAILVCACVGLHMVRGRFGMIPGRFAAIVRRLFSPLGLSIALLIISTAIYLSYDSPLMQALPALAGRSANFSGRTPIWAVSKRLIAESPVIGTGYIDTKVFTEMTGVRAGTTAHSFLLAVLLSTGFVGLALVLYVMFEALRPIPMLDKTPACLCALGVVTNLFIGITSCNAYSMLTIPLLLITYKISTGADGVAEPA